MMIKTRLKNIGIKITELSDYLNISRPTMYKFIEAYDSGEHSMLNEKVLNLFNYIQSNPLIGRKAVTIYLLSNFSTRDHNKHIDKQEDSTSCNIETDALNLKSEFSQLIYQTQEYDKIIEYLLKVYPLLTNQYTPSDEEVMLVEYYREIKNIVYINLGEK